ncbi:MAG: hypothetical protein K2W78_07580 [Xanthobacteraceae bacterium]|nr:hypothetical protein [Xanthobacteraceae bacterium]
MANLTNAFELPEMWNSNNEAMKASVCNFWQNQTKLLDNMQEFTLGWFDRRHVGTHAALDATQKICQAKSPADALASYQEWVAGVAARIVEDEVAYQKLMSSAVSCAAPAPMELSQKAKEQATLFPGVWAAA